MNLTNGGTNDSIRQGVNSELHQLSQNVVLGTSFNDIANTMNLTIGVDPTAQVNQINAAGAMGAMRGIGY